MWQKLELLSIYIYANKVEEKLSRRRHLISHIPILRHVSSKERASFFFLLIRGVIVGLSVNSLGHHYFDIFGPLYVYGLVCPLLQFDDVSFHRACFLQHLLFSLNSSFNTIIKLHPTSLPSSSHLLPLTSGVCNRSKVDL